MDFRQAIDAVAVEHGFDVSEPTVKAWINDRYATAVVATRWRLAEQTLAATQTGVTDYALTAPIPNDIETVWIGARRFIPASYEEMRALLYGNARVEEADGAFTLAFDSDGNQLARISPAPTSAGDAITALVALEPVLLDGDDDVPIIPTDLHKPILVDGPIATGLERDAERLQEAAYFSTSFTNGVAQLERRRHRRFGRGPTKIRRGW